MHQSLVYIATIFQTLFLNTTNLKSLPFATRSSSCSYLCIICNTRALVQKGKSISFNLGSLCFSFKNSTNSATVRPSAFCLLDLLEETIEKNEERMKVTLLHECGGHSDSSFYSVYLYKQQTFTHNQSERISKIIKLVEQMNAFERTKEICGVEVMTSKAEFYSKVHAFGSYYC